MPDFLLELRSEEIPARMQVGARAELEKLFHREMEQAGITLGALTVWSTPRRLALIARDLPEATQATSEERKGPRADAPDQAVEGFLRSVGLTRDQLETRDIKGKPTLFARIETPGRAMADVLAQAIPAIIRDFAWPRSMRWGAASISTESVRWVRPLAGIVALLGDTIVECEVHGVTSGAVTLGHRFHHAGDITIGGADDYAVKLRAAHVVVDHAEREATIREGRGARVRRGRAGRRRGRGAGGRERRADRMARAAAGRVRRGVSRSCRRKSSADRAAQPEILRLHGTERGTARRRMRGTLAVPTLKVRRSAPADRQYRGANDRRRMAIVYPRQREGPGRAAGRRALLLGAGPQERRWLEHAEGLARITFHEKLGTVADKVERVAKLARWLVEEGIVKSSPETGRGTGRFFSGGRGTPSPNEVS